MIEFVARLEGATLVLVVLAVVAAESLVITDIVAPGEVGLVVAGAAAAHNGTPVGWVIAAATVGAIAGDSVGFMLGRRYGDQVVDRWRWTRRLRPSLDRARHSLERRGAFTVAAARWVGALRALVPVVAGTARMPVGRFYAFDAPSAAAWSATVVTIGFVWGDDLAGIVDRIGLGISVVVVAAIVVAVIVVRRRRQRGRSGGER